MAQNWARHLPPNLPLLSGLLLQGTEHYRLHPTAQLRNLWVIHDISLSSHIQTHQVLSILLPKCLCVSVYCHFYNLSSDYHHLFYCFNPTHQAPCLPLFPSNPLSTSWPPWVVAPDRMSALATLYPQMAPIWYRRAIWPYQKRRTVVLKENEIQKQNKRRKTP